MGKPLQGTRARDAAAAAAMMIMSQRVCVCVCVCGAVPSPPRTRDGVRNSESLHQTGTLLLIIMSHARHLCDTVTSSSDTLCNIVQSRSKTQWPVPSSL